MTLTLCSVRSGERTSPLDGSHTVDLRTRNEYQVLFIVEIGHVPHLKERDIYQKGKEDQKESDAHRRPVVVDATVWAVRSHPSQHDIASLAVAYHGISEVCSDSQGYPAREGSF